MKRLLLPIGLAAFLVALLLAGVTFLGETAPARADFTLTTPAVTGTIKVYQPNQLYVLTATGYAPNDQVDITFNGTRLFNGVADGSGQLTNTAKIPVVPFGSSYIVQAKNQNNVVATYTASISPFLLTGSGQGSPGSPLRIEGVGFAMGERVTVTFRSVITCTGTEEDPDTADTNISLGVVTTTNVGTFRINTTVPVTGAGTYYVGALGQSSNYCTVAN